MWVVLLLIIVGISPGFTFVVLEQEASLCRSEEFSCNDGKCISLNKYCDGQRDCFNGADEDCGVSLDKLLQDDVTLSRFKRQTSKCRGQLQCRDGSCVGLETKCDGIVDCPDGSDETFALCRKTPCQDEWFRCNYGACVDGGAPCNGYKECADNSDELLPRCRNETDGQRGQFRCGDGQIISVAKSCDGVKDCKDGTDETLRTCAGVKCPSYLFQCAYGACIDEGSDCNNITECADGSDESDELCKPNAVPLITTTSTTTAATIQTGNCVLPPYPAHGRYTVAGDPKLGPGNSLPSVYLNLTCNAGYGVEDQKTTVYCYDGYWSADPFPKCVRLCRLNPHPSVEYQCLISGSNGIEGTRPCSLFEPVGTSVRPVCKKPNYYYSGVLSLMRCSEGGWNYVATCLPECGRITPEGDQLIIDGRYAQRGELPWHAGIYRKTTTPYMQICGGSLVTSTVVISAAHCFWSDVKKQLPAEHYAVAVGKLYRPWNNPKDEDAQKSDVSDIKIPSRFQGVTANFQDDIAMVILATVIEFKVYVRPVCVDFDVYFDRSQLSEGKFGKVAGWGLSSENGDASQILKVVELPYVRIDKCIAESPPGFREYITSDKICAGYTNGTALCKGDSGGGLAFPEPDRGIERYYLRGIVSVAPRNDNKCNANTLTSFTQLIKHEHFIKEFI